jgi:cytochrome c-type biogenesis protein
LIGPTTLMLAFLAGVLTILSPCVLPLAPIVIAGGRAKSPRGPFALAAGLALTFGIIGGVLAALGVEFGDAGWVRATSAVVMIVVGVVMAAPRLSVHAERLLSPSSRFADALAARLPNAGLWGQAGVGVVLAFAWAPCAGPTLGAAFSLAASGGSLPATMAVMTIFAFGAATSLLAAGYGLGRLAASGRKFAGSTGQFGRVGFGVAFVVVGALILSGLDHRIEAVFIETMPGWLVNFATQL